MRDRRAALTDKARAGKLRLPEAVAEMRHALGLPQPEFAKRFRLTTRQLADSERGAANPTAATLAKIGRAFGLQIGFVPIQPPTPSDPEPAPDEPSGQKM